MAKIELRGITKIFGPRPSDVLERVLAGASKESILEETGHTVGINNVDLSVKEGETFVVMGLSGSGKSTLIRHLNRLIEPTAGDVIVDGEDVMRLDETQLREFRRAKMSMVFQRFGLFPHRTVLDNVSFGLDIRARGGAEQKRVKETAWQWVETVGLAGYEDSFPHELSGGMQQRVGLARALATDADILLMDEAFSALDPLIRRDMQDQLLELQERLNKTIVFITHDLDEALRLGDKIAILKDGEVVQVGTGEEILQNPATAYVAAFVEDVNRGRVLTAGTCKLACAVVRSNESADAALRAIGDNEIKVTYVVDGRGKLIGALTVGRARQAAKRDGVAVENLAEPVPVARSDMVLEEVLPLTLDSDLPVAVVDDNGTFQGMLPKNVIIAALAEQAEVGGEDGKAKLS